MRKALLVAAVLLLGGCAKQFHVENLSGTRSEAKLASDKGVFVATPEDGRYESTTYPGSGQTVAQVLAGAFSKYAAKVNTAAAPGSLESALSEARDDGASYLVLPTITHWEQRATAWSGIPSKMSIRITVYNVDSRAELTSTSIDGRSAIMTILPTSPESLLKAPVEKFVASLYR
jgi:hypothetical protein